MASTSNRTPRLPTAGSAANVSGIKHQAATQLESVSKLRLRAQVNVRQRVRTITRNNEHLPFPPINVVQLVQCSNVKLMKNKNENLQTKC